MQNPEKFSRIVCQNASEVKNEKKFQQIRRELIKNISPYNFQRYFCKNIIKNFKKRGS